MKTATIRPRANQRSQDRFALIVSQFNIRYTQALADHAIEEIHTLEGGAKTEIIWAPGTFEIPVLAKLVAARHEHDVIIAVGVVLQGKTPHAHMIVSSATMALQQVAIETSVPIIDCILFADTIEIVEERCSGEENNRGIEAARAAVSMARSARRLSPSRDTNGPVGRWV